MPAHDHEDRQHRGGFHPGQVAPDDLALLVPGRIGPVTPANRSSGALAYRRAYASPPSACAAIDARGRKYRISGTRNSVVASASARSALDPVGNRSPTPPEADSEGRLSTASATAVSQPSRIGYRIPTDDGRVHPGQPADHRLPPAGRRWLAGCLPQSGQPCHGIAATTRIGHQIDSSPGEVADLSVARYSTPFQRIVHPRAASTFCTQLVGGPQGSPITKVMGVTSTATGITNSLPLRLPRCV